MIGIQSIPIHVLLRSRAGDFCYGENDIRIMSEDAKLLVEAGADGIVFGCLDPEANIDVKNCQTILESVKPRSNINFTFHRAFDLAQNPMKSAEVIKNLGFSRILTSGQVLLLGITTRVGMYKNRVHNRFILKFPLFFLMNQASNSAYLEILG